MAIKIAARTNYCAIFEQEPEDTAAQGLPPMELNTQGQVCLTRYGKGYGKKKFIFFVEEQWCKHCKAKKFHIPNYCPKSPEGQKRKADNDKGNKNNKKRRS